MSRHVRRSLSSPWGPLEAIVFDFDGVIIESVDIKTEAFLSLFEDRPEHLQAIREHHEENVGLSRYLKFEWIYRELFRQSLGEDEKTELGESYSKLVLEQVLTCPFVRGAVELLRALSGRCPLFVASGTPEDELRFVVEERALAPFFESVRGTPATKPTILREVLESVGCPAERALMIGDGLSDYQAAQEVDVRFVGRVFAERPSPFGDPAPPLVQDLLELAEMLGVEVGDSPVSES